MRTRYGVAIINKSTGEIEHMLSNDSPISDAATNVVDGPPGLYKARRFEYKSDKHVLARKLLGNIKVRGATSADRGKPGAPLDFIDLPEVARWSDKEDVG